MRGRPAVQARWSAAFVARYKLGGRAHRLHEVSRFQRREGRWYYLDGDLGPGTAPGDQGGGV
jgi:uncharacterized protein YchJ